MEKIIRIEGMSCKHCQGQVEKLLKNTSDVSGVSVDLEKKEAVFTSEPEVNISSLVEAINGLGFTASVA